MAERPRLDRRSFLQNAGMTALLAGVSGGSALTAEPGATEPFQGQFDFDEVYNRFGTDSTKFDRQIRLYGKGSIEVGMGIADMDFRAAPSITKAIKDRVQHENWGYLDEPRMILDAVVSWNKRRYGVDINPDQMVLSSRRAPSTDLGDPGVLASRQQGADADAGLQRLLFRSPCTPERRPKRVR